MQLPCQRTTTRRGSDSGGVLAIGVALLACAAIASFKARSSLESACRRSSSRLPASSIWQGVIQKTLQARDTIIIEDNWINNVAGYFFSANVAWLIAAIDRPLRRSSSVD